MHATLRLPHSRYYDWSFTDDLSFSFAALTFTYTSSQRRTKQLIDMATNHQNTTESSAASSNNDIQNIGAKCRHLSPVFKSKGHRRVHVLLDLQSCRHTFKVKARVGHATKRGRKLSIQRH